jgi:hypothetical protein
MAFRRRRRDEPRPAAAPEPVSAPAVYTGTTIEPDEGAAERINSAADVDPNIKRYGVVVGGPGGAGGYGGAGTK